MKHVDEDDENHQLRGQAMEVSQEDSVRNNKAQIFHVAVGLRSGRMVIKHQQNASDYEDYKEEKRNRSEIVSGADAQRSVTHLYWQEMQEEISEDGETARAVG